MTGLTNIYLKLQEINKEPDIFITQLPDLRFHIEMMGDFMDGYFQLGVILKELEKVCNDNGYILTSVLGDGQDAFLRLKVDRSIL